MYFTLNVFHVAVVHTSFVNSQICMYIITLRIKLANLTKVVFNYLNSGISIFVLTLETSLICILLSASRDVHFDKRMICFLSGLF